MVTIRARRSFAALAGGALLVATLAGCGGSGDKKASDGKPTATSSATSGATDDPTADATKDPLADVKGEEIAPQDFVKNVLSSMRSRKTAHMRIDVGSSMTADADVSYGKQTAMRITMTTGGTTMQAILLDGTVYLQQSAAGKFVKIDKDTPGMGSIIGQFTALGPEASVKAMQGAITKVIKVGEEKVDGDELTKYVLSVDTAKITAQIGTVAGSDLPKVVTYEMFIDEDNLLRRVNMEVSGQKVVMKVTDWGKPLDIKAPPASQIQKQ